jgi:hypothetical protein
MLMNQDRGFGRRLKIYLIGVVLGSLLSYFLLIRNRDFTWWTPERQILMRLGVYHLNWEPKTRCILSCFGKDSSFFLTSLDSAMVDFKRSNTQLKPCPEYLIHTREGWKFRAILCDDSTATLREALPPEPLDSCRCQ